MLFIEAWVHFISQPVVYVTAIAVMFNLLMLLVWNFWVYERNINK